MRDRMPAGRGSRVVRDVPGWADEAQAADGHSPSLRWTNMVHHSTFLSARLGQGTALCARARLWVRRQPDLIILDLVKILSNKKRRGSMFQRLPHSVAISPHPCRGTTSRPQLDSSGRPQGRYFGRLTPDDSRPIDRATRAFDNWSGFKATDQHKYPIKCKKNVNPWP